MSMTETEQAVSILTGKTYLVRDGYAKPSAPKVWVRDMTLEEAKQLASGRHAAIIAGDGTIRRVKINGRVRTWKRDPNRIEVPVKYGMYEYTTFKAMNGRIGNSVAWMVVPVGNE